VGEFEKKHKPELKKLGKILRENKISKEVYFQKNRQYRGELREEFPKLYPSLSLNHINSLKIMWRKISRLMIEDYKKNKVEFPIVWVSKEDLLKAKSLKEYKSVNNTLSRIKIEIEKRKKK